MISGGPVFIAFKYFNAIDEMFNVIIRSVNFYFVLLIFYLARASHQQ